MGPQQLHSNAGGPLHAPGTTASRRNPTNVPGQYIWPDRPAARHHRRPQADPHANRPLTDPLADLTVLTDPETRLRLIMQGGKVKADRLGD